MLPNAVCSRLITAVATLADVIPANEAWDVAWLVACRGKSATTKVWAA